MRRLYEPAAYAPQAACFWADTVAPEDWPALERDGVADVVIIGGGFTGLNAALALARAGRDVAVLEAGTPGFGASGRNGGFCCLGGAKAPDALLRRQFGDEAPQHWAEAERAAVAFVDRLSAGWEIDRHSQGETLLAHTARHWQALQREAAGLETRYGVAPELMAPDALRQAGLGGPWHGGMTLPLGFALNPRKYHAGLAGAAREAGARLFAHTQARGLRRDGDGWQVDTGHARLRARQVLIATNGYSSEDLPGWLAARTLPALSSVIVTRPLTAEEQAAAGWWSAQMAYDTRLLLHYFRLLPDGRFLFGMRGGLSAAPRAQAAISRRIRSDFARLFPAWQGVEITHEWSGLVCLLRALVPFAGSVPGHPGLFAALGYHGNGVAMGSYAGAQIATQMAGTDRPGPFPDWLATPPRRFPLGRFRRSLLRPAYLLGEAFDL
ncbi:NAD(P)/FAD-dependent oxidoreductase [Pseudoponticoccus marisrubri]|uniref:FAD-dependent oxidoreductase n=1 Tax=Pseudoponticoccus marisrubri TaxID=1685382 RepID=A0A0W7WHR5_9RHOB|nr:FAD-binding oxidoreductase [Pseudoponticoccus marisrubri]KUF10129.1 FAD-dependent oxidoreductase [Pseudoponticoccus marisrubri]